MESMIHDVMRDMHFDIPLFVSFSVEDRHRRRADQPRQRRAIPRRSQRRTAHLPIVAVASCGYVLLAGQGVSGYRPTSRRTSCRVS